MVPNLIVLEMDLQFMYKWFTKCLTRSLHFVKEYFCAIYNEDQVCFKLLPQTKTF